MSARCHRSWLHNKFCCIVFLFQVGDDNDKHNWILQIKQESYVKYFLQLI